MLKKSITKDLTSSLLVHHFRGWLEPHVWIDWTVPLNSTSCRGLVIEMASARRFDNEPSPCKRWGLDILVESKERTSRIEGKCQNNRRRALVHSKEHVSKWECLLTKIVLTSSYKQVKTILVDFCLTPSQEQGEFSSLRVWLRKSHQFVCLVLPRISREPVFCL